jgi:hypothetical protein
MERAASNMKHLQFIFIATLAGVMLASVGCSKKETEQPVPPPATTTIDTSEPLSPRPTAPGTTASVTSGQPVASAVISATNSPTGDEETPAQLAAQVKKLEEDYKDTPDLQKRVSIIFDLSSNESTGAVDAVGRLFLNEKEQDLKIELIDSLNDIDGQNDKKLAILNSGLRADQPKEVRMEAIDAIGDVEDKRGIQVLQVYAADPDEEIRDAVKDAIEQLQTATTDTQPPSINGLH